jgi:hypothetical protein
MLIRPACLNTSAGVELKNMVAKRKALSSMRDDDDGTGFSAFISLRRRAAEIAVRTWIAVIL